MRRLLLLLWLGLIAFVGEHSEACLVCSKTKELDKEFGQYKVALFLVPTNGQSNDPHLSHNVLVLLKLMDRHLQSHLEVMRKCIDLQKMLHDYYVSKKESVNHLSQTNEDLREMIDNHFINRRFIKQIRTLHPRATGEAKDRLEQVLGSIVEAERLMDEIIVAYYTMEKNLDGGAWNLTTIILLVVSGLAILAVLSYGVYRLTRRYFKPSA